MNPLIQANIFFVITSVAVILLTILGIVMLTYVVLILRDFRGISQKVREETDLIATDIDSARAHIKEKGASIGSTIDFFRELTKRQKPKHRKKETS